MMLKLHSKYSIFSLSASPDFRSFSCEHRRKDIRTVKRQQLYEIILDKRVNEIVRQHNGNAYAVIGTAKKKRGSDG